jgi:predicted nuclease of predicted toxin-antitoxin system
MKLLVDMNLSPRWIAFLTERGIEALHWATVGSGSALDAEIMAYARTNAYVVLTHDLDFGAILAATQGAKPSVIQIRAEEVGPDSIGPEILAVLRQLGTELEAGALITVDPKHTRVRVLPLYGRA